MVKLNLPQFWYAHETNRSPLMTWFLMPLSYLYQGIRFIHQSIQISRRSPIPVICIGNLTMGGAGKTPTARAILDVLKKDGRFATPCFLMRGYGGKAKGPIEVDPTLHTLWDVGDEALMQATYAPVIVSRNRYKGAVLAKKRGYDIIIMDDGFQNRTLKKDLSFIVIDGGFGFGNECCFPAGPLREPIKSGISRADAAIVINRDQHTDTSSLDSFKQFDAKIHLVNKGQDQQDNKKIIAFAGIARPEKFFETLENNGYELYAHYKFPDHHTYTHGQLRNLVSRSEKAGATLMTTEKDWARLSSRWRDQISYLKIAIEFDQYFERYLLGKLKSFG